MASPEPKYQKTTLVGAAMDPATQAVLVFGQYDTLMEELQRESQGDFVCMAHE